MEKVKIHLGTHRVLIEEKIFEERTKSGIIIAGCKSKLAEYQAMACEGRIKVIADDAFDWLPEERKPKVNQVVYFKKYDGRGLFFNEVPYRIIIDELIDHWTDEFIEEKDEIC